MRKLFLTISSLFLCIFCHSQEADLSALAGEWKWTDEASGEEFYIILKPGVFEIPSIFGGGTKDCLIGGYTHIKNGTIVSDNSLEIEDTKRSIDYPIRVLWNYSVDIRDENIFNAKGEKKIISGSSRIEYISACRIRLILSDDHEAIYSSNAEIFPAGTSLPTNIILDRVAHQYNPDKS